MRQTCWGRQDSEARTQVGVSGVHLDEDGVDRGVLRECGRVLVEGEGGGVVVDVCHLHLENHLTLPLGVLPVLHHHLQNKKSTFKHHLQQPIYIRYFILLNRKQ